MMLAERLPGARRGSRKRAGGKQRVPQTFGQVLNTDHLVDGRTHQRELQSLGHADIAVDNLAHMQRNAKIKRRVIGDRLRCVEPPARFAGGGKRAAAGLIRRALEAKQTKHRVADQRDHLAAMVEHRGRGHLEIATQ